MTQIDIFDVMSEDEKKSKRLVKNHLSTFEYRLLRDLKDNHVAKENAVSVATLADTYDITERQVRGHIKRLRKYQDVRISSCSSGYYIPLISEQLESDRMMISHVISRMDTIIDINNKYIMILYKHLNERAKTLDTATQGQLKMQFNGWETDSVNYFGDKYKGGTNGS
jgi:biotin operon repressor